MNTRYTQLFIYLSRRSNKGFMLVLAGAIGIVMAVTAGAMLLNSSSKSEQVIAQKATFQGKSVGEVAVARIQFLLSEYPVLAQNNSADWAKVDNNTTTIGQEFEETIASSCDSSDLDETKKTAIKTQIKSYSNSKWQNLDENNKAQGQFKLLSYQAPSSIPGLGTLTVQGKANTENKSKESPTQLVVKIPVRNNTLNDGDVPGLWIQEGDTEKSGGNQNLFAAHIWFSDCDLGGKTEEQVETALADITANVEVGTADADTRGEISNGTTFQAPKLAAYGFPDLPSIPNDLPTDQKGLTISGNGGGNGNQSSHSNNNAFSTIAHVTNGFVDKTWNNLFVGVALAQTTGTISPCGTNSGTGNVFPRAGDQPTKEKTLNGESICVYEYEITSIDGAAEVKTVSDDGKRQQVIFHLLGNMNKGSDIDHSCDGYGTKICKSTDFQLFAHATDGQICLNGNNKFHGFLFAPGYDVGVNGSGGGKGGINGTAWVKTWNKTDQCSSNSKSAALVVQTGEWSDLGVGIPKGLSPVLVGQPTTIQTEEYSQ
ncbi:MAG: hypothetical protein AAGF26_02450 [Cyanobacteria bacterium P01_G01_bin.49]